MRALTPELARELQLQSAAARKSHTAARRLTEQIEQLAANAPELTDEQFDTLARIIVRESARRVTRRPIGPPAQRADAVA